MPMNNICPVPPSFSTCSPKRIFLAIIVIVGAVLMYIRYNKIDSSTMDGWLQRIITGNISVGEDEISGNIPGNGCAGRSGISGRWYNFSSDIFRLYAYSAFYDNRTTLKSPPVIRIIAISDPFEDFDKLKNSQLYCVLNYSSTITVRKMKGTPLPVGFGWPLNKKQAREYVYGCPTDDMKIPSSIGLSTKPTADISVSIPVTIPYSPPPECVRDFCVCVQVAFGDLNPHRLIEWLELLKLIGVSLVGVYNLSVSKPGMEVLRYYAKEGLVDLRDTDEIYHGDYKH